MLLKNLRKIVDDKKYNVEIVADEWCNTLEDIKYFNPKHIFECGQCFRWIKQEDDSYTGVAMGKVINVKQEGNKIYLDNTTKEDFDNIWYDYFDLGRDYESMVNTLKEEFTLLSSVALLKQDRKIMNGYFLTALLNNEDMYTDIRNKMGGAAITRLTIAKLNAIKVMVPPIDLQNQFATFVHQVNKSKFVIHKFLYCTTHNTKSIIKPRPNTKESGKIRGRETTCRRILTF